MPAETSGAKPRRRSRWLLPASLAGGLCLAAGAAGTWVLMAQDDGASRPRLSSLKVGPLPEMPDLRNGVPALMSSLATTKPAASPADEARLARAMSAPPAPAPDAAEDANRKAMASTIASANLRPAIATSPTDRTAPPRPVAEARAAAPAAPAIPAPPPVAAAPSPDPGTVRQIDIAKPAQTASIGEPRSVSVPAVPAPPPPAAAPPEATSKGIPDARMPKPAPETAPVAPSAEAAPANPEPTEIRAASLPQEAPLPPRRPSLQVAEPAERAAPAPRQVGAERAAAPKPRPVAAAAARPATAGQAPAPQPVAPPEEERSLLGIPVPGFVPTGRDVRDAAATVTNAVTGLVGF